MAFALCKCDVFNHCVSYQIIFFIVLCMGGSEVWFLKCIWAMKLNFIKLRC